MFYRYQPCKSKSNLQNPYKKAKFGDGEMAQQIKVFATETDLSSLGPCDRRGELTPASCPPTATHKVWYKPTQTHTVKLKRSVKL